MVDNFNAEPSSQSEEMRKYDGLTKHYLNVVSGKTELELVGAQCMFSLI